MLLLFSDETGASASSTIWAAVTPIIVAGAVTLNPVASSAAWSSSAIIPGPTRYWPLLTLTSEGTPDLVPTPGSTITTWQGGATVLIPGGVALTPIAGSTTWQSGSATATSGQVIANPTAAVTTWSPPVILSISGPVTVVDSFKTFGVSLERWEKYQALNQEFGAYNVQRK
jgi:hypothetical protein